MRPLRVVRVSEYCGPWFQVAEAVVADSDDTRNTAGKLTGQVSSALEGRREREPLFFAR
jgi:hypothetical protein